jgi:hypothetical protein
MQLKTIFHKKYVVALLTLPILQCGGGSNIRVDKKQFATNMKSPVILPLYSEKSIFPTARADDLELKFPTEYQVLITQKVRERASRFDSVLSAILGKPQQPIIGKPVSEADIVKASLAAHPEWSFQKTFENEYFMLRGEKIQSLAAAYPQATCFIFHFVNVHKEWHYYTSVSSKAYTYLPTAMVTYNMVIYDREGRVIYGGPNEFDGQINPNTLDAKKVRFKLANYRLFRLEDIDYSYELMPKKFRTKILNDSQIAWPEIEASNFQKNMLSPEGLYGELKAD